MREIKFRAWDGHSMIYNTTPYADLGDGRTLCIGSQGYRYREEFETSVDCNAIYVMQLTGLRDTTPEKAELWEDDIVEHGEMPYHVVWNNKQGYWAARPLITTEFETMLFWLIDEGDCVKVGNVHENPEFLGV